MHASKSKLFCSFIVLFLLSFGLLFNVPALALEQKPVDKVAQWWGEDWGKLRVLPMIARYGDQVHIHGMVVGGAAADPFWSCSQYVGWSANGTSSVSITVPGTWDMPFSGHDIFGNKVNIMKRDAGELPPYGWEDRISDTCYCVVTSFGANGGCKSREHQPMLFRMMDQSNPREGNVQFATVNGKSGWTAVKATFKGNVGVAWSDTAKGYVYVVSNESQLDEDSDGDGISDAWEYAHSPNQSLDDFGGSSTSGSSMLTSAANKQQLVNSSVWVNPYAPRDSGWVPVSINDWDGDHISNLTEFLNWKKGIKTTKDTRLIQPLSILPASFPYIFTSRR